MRAVKVTHPQLQTVSCSQGVHAGIPVLCNVGVTAMFLKFRRRVSHGGLVVHGSNSTLLRLLLDLFVIGVLPGQLDFAHGMLDVGRHFNGSIQVVQVLHQRYISQ